MWLGDNLDHYYILSRFLICRMLTVTRIPYIKVCVTPKSMGSETSSSSLGLQAVRHMMPLSGADLQVACVSRAADAPSCGATSTVRQVCQQHPSCRR